MIKSTKRGFTLIELLVVIAIIGMLSSVVLASMNSARRKSRDARRISDVASIKTALEMKYDAQQTYPLALADIETAYIANVPNDPVGGVSYTYEPMDCAAGPDTPCLSFRLGAALEDVSNPALLGDADTADGLVFDGTGTNCANSGTPQGQTDPTEACYDVQP